MKGIWVIALVSLISFTSCNKKQNATDDEITSDLINNPASASKDGNGKDKAPKIKFLKTEHDFEKLIEGEKVSFSFKFTNTGNASLIISNVVPSCGCTVPKFPDKPIQPGESDYIDIVFNSENRPGNFIKDVTVYANTIPNTHMLYIKGFVERKK